MILSLSLSIILLFVPQVIDVPEINLDNNFTEESVAAEEEIDRQDMGDSQVTLDFPRAGLRVPTKISESRSLGIETTAKAALVYDVTSGASLFEKNAQQKLSLASITKLMTALVFLDFDPNWKKTIQLTRADDKEGGIFYARAPEEISTQDLFNMMLVGSVNNAAYALSRSAGITKEEFIEKMNEKARELSLDSLVFTDPSGLDHGNMGTAKDVAKLVYYALENDEIKEAVVQKNYVFNSVGNLKKYYIRNTNSLLRSFLNQEPFTILGGKTGYTEEAGYNLAVKLEKDNHRVIVVVLGSETIEDRFNEVKGLTVWSFENYKW